MADFQYWNNDRGILRRIFIDNPDYVQIDRDETSPNSWTIRIDGVVIVEFDHVGSTVLSAFDLKHGGHTFTICGGENG